LHPDWVRAGADASPSCHQAIPPAIVQQERKGRAQSLLADVPESFLLRPVAVAAAQDAEKNSHLGEALQAVSSGGRRAAIG
jgi:hypothetical protein